MDTYTCGCRVDDIRFNSYCTNIEKGAFGQDVLTHKRKRADGEEVCPIHGKPRSGYLTGRSYEKVYGKMNGFDPFAASTIKEDKRDNSDPSVIGHEILAAKAASTNGHALLH